MAQLPDELASKSVLVLEDNLVISEGICLQFERLGFNSVRAVCTLAEASNLAEDRLPDIALLDVNVGRGETSFAFARSLLDRGVTVMFATGFIDQRELPDDTRNLVFLTKPFFTEQLAQALLDATG